MGRREDRELLESSWTVLEPRMPGTPFTKKDIEDSAEPRAKTAIDDMWEREMSGLEASRPGIREDSPDLERLRRILK